MGKKFCSNLPPSAVSIIDPFLESFFRILLSKESNVDIDFSSFLSKRFFPGEIIDPSRIFLLNSLFLSENFSKESNIDIDFSSSLATNKRFLEKKGHNNIGGQEDTFYFHAWRERDFGQWNDRELV